LLGKRVCADDITVIRRAEMQARNDFLVITTRDRQKA
jgi:hypothetical protein